jgi:YaiO family outer membrane protein
VIPHPVRTNLIISTRGLTSMAILMSFSALIVMVNMALPAFAEISTAQTQMIKPNPADWEEFQKTVDALGGNQQEKENLLRGWLSHYPDDLEARFYLARVLSWQGNYQESLKQYEMLLQQFPQNADYLLGKASVLIWRNTPEQAIAVLEPAIAKNPDYVDLYRTKLRALQQWAQTEKSKVQEAEAFRKEVQQRFPAEKWPTLPEEELPPVELETGYGYEHLTNRYSHWSNQYFSVKTPLSQHNGLYARIERTDRFDKADLGLSGGAYFRIPNSRWQIASEGSISPTNTILPRWSVSGQLQRKLPLGFVASAGYRHTEYRDAATELGVYTLENYWRKYHLSYTLYQSYLHHGGPALSHMAKLGYHYGDRNYISLTGTMGHELINLGPQGVMKAEVQSLGLAGLQMVKPTWGISYLFLLQKQGDLYTRRGFQLGLRYFI